MLKWSYGGVDVCGQYWSVLDRAWPLDPLTPGPLWTVMYKDVGRVYVSEKKRRTAGDMVPDRTGRSVWLNSVRKWAAGSIPAGPVIPGVGAWCLSSTWKYVYYSTMKT